MRAGFAVADITPEVGCTLGGFAARPAPSNGIDTPIECRVLCLHDGDAPAIVASFDLLGLTRDSVIRWRQRIERELGVPAGRIAFACSHTHSGPMSCPLRSIGTTDDDYVARVEAGLLDAVKRAIADLRDATPRWGEAPVTLGMNRRVREGNKVKFGMNPDGPTDHLVRVLALERSDHPIAVMLHACHPYVFGAPSLLISADFCGYAVSAMRERGYEAMYLNGCAGNIAPLAGGQGVSAALREGRRLADAAMMAIRSSQAPPAGASDRVWMATRDHPVEHDALVPIEQMKQEDAAQLKWWREAGTDETLVRKVELSRQEWLADLTKAIVNNTVPPMRTSVGAMTLGGRSIAFLPGEIFFETGTDIGKRVGDPHTWVVGYAHDFIGYVPTREEAPYGGYEVDEAYRYINLWRTAPDAAEKLAIAAAEMIGESKRQS